MKIGLMGISFSNPNKGVCALAYSCMFLLDKISKDNRIDFDYILFVPKEDNSHDEIATMKNVLCISELNIKIVNTALVDYKQRKIANKSIKECDIIIDFSLGDSFSDIYGTKRFVYYSYFKLQAARSKAKFILAPQTYGPFSKSYNKYLAKYIINKADCVLTRDNLSSDYIKSLTKKEHKIITDIAFSLPYNKSLYELNSNKQMFGINISMLLWNGGYHKNNDFGMVLDYQEYCKKIIEWALNNEFEVHVIPHVIVMNDYDSPENDVKACHILKKLYPNIIVAPPFTNPIEAKSYIANMDVFVGSRMHSTIAALSAKVLTIPVSYSRKFEGLFSTLNYDIGINGKVDSTEIAIKKTIEYVKNHEANYSYVINSEHSINDRLLTLENELKAIVNNE
jgi:polysaccharide pyruvyl transferase WcaK-like protein